jgi:maltose-binding protein MalE
VTTDIATKGGQFDVMTIGMYETPIWGKKGWLNELKTDAAYDVDDLLPAMRGLSVDGKLYAAPFYGESSMLMYRKDLTEPASPCRASDLGRHAMPPPRSRPETACTASACAASRLGRQHGLPHDDGEQLRRAAGSTCWKPHSNKPWKDALSPSTSTC